ncbi:MAG: MmcQ/YjbR family DNA-binding protein [Oligoflexia bacterium]|nr:MmcQ/YjbR family DNA-binding protein [Oligoflexia bacterium]
MKFSEVSEIALAMNDVEEGTSYGTPAFKTNGILFVRYRPELESIVVAMDFDERESAIAEAPETYYLTDHYLNYPWILVRLTSIKKTGLRDLLFNAKKFAETKKRSKRITRRKNGK